MEQAMNQGSSQAQMSGASMSAGKKEGKGMMVGMALCAVLAVAGIGFGVYEMTQASKANQQISDLKIEVKNNDGTVTTLETDVIETVNKDGTTIKISDSSNLAIANNYAERDLRNKTIRLMGGAERLYDSNFFETTINYIPFVELYSNTLTEAQKTYLFLETSSSMLSGYTYDEAIANDVPEHAAQYPYSSPVDYKPAAQAKVEFYDLFGTDITTECSTDCKYGSNNDAYYRHVLGGRGGAWIAKIIGRISSITTEEDKAYVNLNAGMIYNDPEYYQVYNKVTDAIGYDVESTISGAEAYNGANQFKMTDDNYSQFQAYRFVFKKNAKGFYSFEKVEEV